MPAQAVCLVVCARSDSRLCLSTLCECECIEGALARCSLGSTCVCRQTSSIPQIALCQILTFSSFPVCPFCFLFCSPFPLPCTFDSLLLLCRMQHVTLQNSGLSPCACSLASCTFTTPPPCTHPAHLSPLLAATPVQVVTKHFCPCLQVDDRQQRLPTEQNRRGSPELLHLRSDHCGGRGTRRAAPCCHHIPGLQPQKDDDRQQLCTRPSCL